MQKTIDRLSMELDEKVSMISELQEQLKKDGISLSDAGAPDSVKPASFDGVLEEVSRKSRKRSRAGGASGYRAF